MKKGATIWLRFCFAINGQITDKTISHVYKSHQKVQKTRSFFTKKRVFLELVAGLEPATCALRMRCSTN